MSEIVHTVARRHGAGVALGAGTDMALAWCWGCGSLPAAVDKIGLDIKPSHPCHCFRR